MLTIEERLRASLADQVRVLGIGDDMAGTAIRAGRAIRHRRWAMAMTAGAAAVAMVACVRPAAGPTGPTPSGGSGAFGTVPVVTESPTATAPEAVKLDVVDAGSQLHTVDGRRYDLSGGARIRYVERVPVGWLFGRDRDDRAWLLRPDGTTVTLRAVVHQAGLEQPWRPVVSADGQRIAWVDGTTAYAGRLTADGERDVVASPIGADAFARTWIGTRVVLGQTFEGGCCGYNHAQYDIWDPAKGDFAPQWTRGLDPVYGPVPEGRPAFGIRQIQAPAMAACLSKLDAVRDLSDTGQACPSGLIVGSLQSSLSPDGRYLFEPMNDRGTVFDLSAFPAGPGGTCPAGSTLAWEDATHLIVQAQDGQFRCDVTTFAASRIAPLDPGSTLVRRYGAPA